MKIKEQFLRSLDHMMKGLRAEIADAAGGGIYPLRLKVKVCCLQNLFVDIYQNELLDDMKDELIGPSDGFQVNDGVVGSLCLIRRKLNEYREWGGAPITFDEIEDWLSEIHPDQPVLTFGMGEQDLETITVRDLRGTEKP